MAVERIIYKMPFHKDRQPEWMCPTCRRGVLEGVKDSFFYKETNESKQAHKLDDWEPEWIRYVYSCFLRCVNPQCKEFVASVGVGSVDFILEYDNDTGEPSDLIHYDYFQAKFFTPHLKIFNVPENTPDTIKKEIERSFELFFSNPSAAANQSRKALEKMLDYLNVKKSYITKKGKKRRADLHQRIDWLPKKYDSFKDLLFAIKWLGNDGSHDSITIDDVMDMYDIFELTLSEVFDNRTKGTKKMAKKINKQKGSKK